MVPARPFFIGRLGWVRSRAESAPFIDPQHHGMGRRIDIEADDIVELLGECRVVGELEAPPAMRSEAMRLPDALDGRRLGRRPPPSPATSSASPRTAAAPASGGRPRRRAPRDRRLAGRTRLVAQKSIDAGRHEPLLPAPHAGLGLAGLGHDRVVPKPSPVRSTIRARQTCFCTLLGSATIVSNRRRSRTRPKGDPAAHAADSRSRERESQFGPFRFDHSTRCGMPRGSL